MGYSHRGPHGSSANEEDWMGPKLDGTIISAVAGVSPIPSSPERMASQTEETGLLTNLRPVDGMTSFNTHWAVYPEMDLFSGQRAID